MRHYHLIGLTSHVKPSQVKVEKLKLLRIPYIFSNMKQWGHNLGQDFIQTLISLLLVWVGGCLVVGHVVRELNVGLYKKTSC